MGTYPKLKVKGIGWEKEGETWDFEQGRYFSYHDRNTIITVEKKVIQSFEYLVELAEMEEHKGKKTLEVLFLPIIVGG